ERFHGAATGARGVEDQHLETGSLEDFFGALDAVGGVAEHAGDNNRLIRSLACSFPMSLPLTQALSPSEGEREPGIHHAANCAGGEGEDLAGNPVEAGDINDAGKYDNVLGADVLGGVAAGERGDH